MKRLRLLTAGTILAGTAIIPMNAQTLPPKAEVLNTMRRVNAYFMHEWPDPGKDIVTNKTRPSNIWTRAVYYEGLMALYGVDNDPNFYNYAVRWARDHHWQTRKGTRPNGADDECCGQTYLELYQIDPKPVRIRDIKAVIDKSLHSSKDDYWWWIDALQMAMPVYAKLGVITGNPAYFQRMYELYSWTKNHGGKSGGLFNPKDGLWWRDRNFTPPYKEPNGQDLYWSRGNGWVMAAMARVLDVLPKNAPHREEYVTMLQTMAKAVKKVQRPDGFWNVSLHDPDHFGGKETSGTALFTFAIAWGINHGILSREEYLPVVTKAWDAMSHDAVHPNGFLGYVQGTGKEPSDGQPVTYDHKPDFDDYGVGCFLLAGSQMYHLAPKAEKSK